MSSDKVGKKSGAVKWQDFENEDYLRCLDPLLQQLNDEIPSARYDRKTLARLFGELQQFMEDALGKQALPPKPFPKLPQKLLRDYSPDGPLNIIATLCHRVKTESNWKRVEFLNPARKRENVELLRLIRKELQRQKYLQIPVVCIHPSCGGDVGRLKDAVQKLGGEVAASPSDARVTHVVYPFGPGGDPDDGLEYMRTLQFRGPQALVHFWYLPDSYDEYIPRHVAPDNLEVDRKPIGPWKVYIRWVLDSFVYNEWMNPCDYETVEFQNEQEQKEAKLKLAAGAGTADRIRTPPAPSAVEDEDDDGERAMEEEGEEGVEGGANLKRKRVEESVDGVEKEAAGDELASKARRVEVDPTGSERIGPNAVRQRIIQPYAPAMEGDVRTENLSQGQKNVLMVPGVEKPVLPPKPLRPVPPMVKKELYTVPAHSAWFQWHKIHDIERRQVPDFFNGKSASKTPELYVEYRNFMISKYREDPTKKLTFTECRKYLLGDVTGIMRVWQFLDQWGLINYMARDGQKEEVEIETKSAPGAAVKVVTAPEAPSPNLLFNFSMPVVEPTVAATYGANNLSLVTRRDVFGQRRCAVESAPEKTEFFCNAMPHVNCTELRYHCTKYPDIDLCPQAYAEGRFPPGCTSKDFVRIDRRAQEDDGSGWTSQETLLLLEALEMFGDNWSEVAEHVGSKSQIQCIMHFLQLPIEDQFLDELEEAGKNIGRPVPKTADSAVHGPEEEEEDLIPFADMGNPIMAQMAFLAMAVGPRVAAAAAKRALEVMSQDEAAVLRELQEARTAQTLAVPPSPPPTASKGKEKGERGEKGDEQLKAGGEDGKADGGKDDKGGKEDDADVQPMDTSGEQVKEGAEEDKDAAQADRDGVEAAAETEPTVSKPDTTTAGTGTRTLDHDDEDQGEGVPLDAPISSTKIRVAAATALAAAAVKAKLLADNEEREIQRLVVQVVDQQMKKLDMKLKTINELEHALEQERAALATARRQVDADRIQLQGLRAHMTQSQQGAQGGQAGMNLYGGPGVNPGVGTAAGQPAGGPQQVSQQGQGARPGYPGSFPPGSSYPPQSNPVPPSSLSAPAQNLSTASRGLTMGPGTSAPAATHPASTPLPQSAAAYNPQQGTLRASGALGISSNTPGNTSSSSLPVPASAPAGPITQLRPTSTPTSTSFLNSTQLSQPQQLRQSTPPPLTHNPPSYPTPTPQPTIPISSSSQDQGQYPLTQQAARIPPASNPNTIQTLGPGSLQPGFPGHPGQQGVNLSGGAASPSLASALMPGMLSQAGGLPQGLLGSRPAGLGPGGPNVGMNMLAAAGMQGAAGGVLGPGSLERFLETLKQQGQMATKAQQHRDPQQGPSPPQP